MGKLLLRVVISLMFLGEIVNGAGKQRNTFNASKYITAKRILDKLQTDLIVKKCRTSYSCYPGRCFVAENQEFCLCPEGFTFESGRCVQNRKNCQNFSCYPGECDRKSHFNSCLCPEGYYSETGICKEFPWACKTSDCKPGKCVKEFNAEKCLCPEGFTSKAGRCVEIAYTSAKQVSTVMLMIIVAIASVMLTTFFGICVCYFTRRNNY